MDMPVYRGLREDPIVVGPEAKTALRWRMVRWWCLRNPCKRAGIVTPEGTFVLSFTPRPETPELDVDAVTVDEAHAPPTPLRGAGW